MPSQRLVSILLIGLISVVLTACGGGGGETAGTLFKVGDKAMPATVSGEPFEFQIPLVGGCGGPYVMSVIDGALPPGLSLDNETHSIVGTILEHGDYAYTVLVQDTGCEPFLSATNTYRQDVGVGDITVVGVTQGGEPAEIIPPGEGFNPAAPENPTFNPDYPALPSALFNSFIVLDLVVAGGHAPYRMSLYDAVDVADGPLPWGTQVIFNSKSVSGTPKEEAAEGGAFLLTFEIEDSQGAKGYYTCYWLVYSPPLELVPVVLSDGQAGAQYVDGFSIAGGVGPFIHELVDALDSTRRVSSDDYPMGANDQGPNYAASNAGVPPEGMYITTDTGGLRGIPRRRGSFKLFYHAYSEILASSPGQNVWSENDLFVAVADTFAQDPAYTVENTFATSDPYSRIDDAEQYVEYSLDVLATGGVPEDGYTDAPHSDDREQDPAENPGINKGYTWAIDWDPVGADTDPIPHLEFLEHGVLQTVPGEEDLLIPQLYQTLSFMARDQALPPSAQQEKEEMVRMSVGPDRIVITESTTSFTSNSYDNRPQNDTAMTVKMLIPSSKGDTYRAPDNSDLAGDGDDKIGLPSEAGSSTSVATLLSGMDITRVSVNPTGWWDDTNHLNPKAARPFQHSDGNACYSYGRALAYHGTTYYLGSSYSSNRYQINPAATCVRLPTCTADVDADKGKGIYTDGGKLYVFDSSKYLGVFIVRSDGRLYVPAAFEKSSSDYTHFGDNWTEGHKSAGSSQSVNKIPQMTVSPDGRFAALKLKGSSTYSRTEKADDTAILLIDLTGERTFDGDPYLVIGTGSDGTSTEGEYQFASSLTLTNGYLYYLIGSGTVTGSSATLHFANHYIYRYDLFDGEDAGEFLHEDFNDDWTNYEGAPMQTPFQMFDRSFALYTSCDPMMLGSHGHNAYESSLAPHPFRVSADGSACAIIAGVAPASLSSATSWEYRYYHAWVDYEGELHQLTPSGSGNRRHFSGGGRGIQLTKGVAGGSGQGYACHVHGTFDGPTTRLEISDDGLKVAAVYTRYRSSSTTYAPRRSPDYNDTQYRYRQDIVTFTTTATSEWDAVTRHEISGDDTQNYTCSGGVFSESNSIRWRFGSLVFTKEGDGLVFWGGYSNYQPAAYSHTSYYKYNGAQAFVGSIYSYQFDDNSSGAVKNILSSKLGGSNKTVGSALTSISYSSSSWQRGGGVIKPVGGWISPNRNFLYVINKGALTSSGGSRRDGSVIGVNIRSVDANKSLNTSTTIARTDGRAFEVTGMDSTNGFYPVQYYIAGYSIGYYYYSSIMQQYYQAIGDSERVAATDNGWVYFVSEKSVYGYTSTYTSSAYGGCINQTYYTYGYLTKHIYMFDQDLGGNINKIAGDNWSGSSSYHVVNFLDVSDDGTQLAAVDSTSRYYDWNNAERLTVWSGIQLDSLGRLVGTPTQDKFESGKFVGSTSTFTPQADRIIYAAGTGNENGKVLTRGNYGGTGSKVPYGFPKKNYNVLHAGR